MCERTMCYHPTAFWHSLEEFIIQYTEKAARVAIVIDRFGILVLGLKVILELFVRVGRELYDIGERGDGIMKMLLDVGHRTWLSA